LIRLLYFASVHERLGVDAEDLDLPDKVANVAGLLAHLRNRGENWAEVLSPEHRILVAVNQVMARDTDPVRNGDEVGIFPPVTGG
jgi:molybdopterin synthase sulfur carrier subunit